VYQDFILKRLHGWSLFICYDGYMNIAISELREKLLTLLSKNFNTEQAAKVTDYILWAEMSGNKTQGIVKLTGTEPLQGVVPQHEITVERDTKLSQLINGGANPAPLVTQVATDVVIQKAKEHGFAIVGIHNIHTSNGAQAYYAEQIARNDLIGIVTTRSSAAVSVFGGIDPLFGTNPFGFSFPTNADPIVFDLATSAMTWYGLVVAKARGESIPENRAIDSVGNPTTDPVEAMNGSLLPFDGTHKGAGFGMVSELLAGPLVGAAYGQVEGEWGSLLIAIDPGLLVDVAKFKNGSSDLIKKIKASRKSNQSQDIRIPGELSTKKRIQAQQVGYVDIDEVIYAQLWDR
jgi:L-2-hydroxycarboxylate dehydrogenase (NAD+)